MYPVEHVEDAWRIYRTIEKYDLLSTSKWSRVLTDTLVVVKLAKKFPIQSTLFRRYWKSNSSEFKKLFRIHALEFKSLVFVGIFNSDGYVEDKLCLRLKYAVQLHRWPLKIMDVNQLTLPSQGRLYVCATALLVSLVRRVPAAGQDPFEGGYGGQDGHPSLPHAKCLGVGRGARGASGWHGRGTVLDSPNFSQLLVHPGWYDGQSVVRGVAVVVVVVKWPWQCSAGVLLVFRWDSAETGAVSDDGCPVCSVESKPCCQTARRPPDEEVRRRVKAWLLGLLP